MTSETNDDDWKVPYPDAVTGSSCGFPADDEELEIDEEQAAEEWKVEYPDA